MSLDRVLAHAGGIEAWPGRWLPAALPGALGIAYVVAVHRARHAHGRRWSPWRTASFQAGSALVSAGLWPALERAAAGDLRAHMAQHLLLGMYAPVLLVLGAPVTLLLAATPVAHRARVRAVVSGRLARVPTHLAVATVLAVGGAYVLYLTPLYALSSGVDAVHHLVHAHVLAAGYLFAWAVAGPDPSRHRPRLAWRVGALVVAAGCHGFLAKLLYSRAPRWPPGPPLLAAEVEQAARWMYYGGHVAELALLVALFTAWYRRAPRVRGIAAAGTAIERCGGARRRGTSAAMPMAAEQAHG